MTITVKRAARLLLTLIVASLSAFVIACGDEDDGSTKRPVAGAEVGVYYYTTDSEDEYTLTLSDGCEFLLVIDGGTKSGTYDKKDDSITFKFKNKADGTMTGELSDTTLNVEYNDASMLFLKRVSYKVRFETNDGGTVSDKTVINGKSVTEPQTPTKAGNTFVGWYKDEAYTTPFKFGTDIITSDTTLYAQWVATTDKEYSWVLDDGNGNSSSVSTKGGQLFDLPEPTLDGFKFLGWWIAASDGTPTEKYVPGVKFREDGTLIALWQSTAASAKLQTPVVNVSATGVSWDSVEDAREYSVEITPPTGATERQTVSGTTFSYNFAAKAAGEYVVKVTAVAADTSKNSDAAQRIYKNKVLGKASGFTEVGDSVLLFDAVENAEWYDVTIDCGDSNHNHKNVRTTSTLIDYSTCAMKEGGIVFTVVAHATGWADSEKSVKTIDRTLAAVTGYTVDEDTQTVKWAAVPKTTNYIVTVTGTKNGKAFTETVDNGTSTSISVKEYEGTVKVKVTPQTKGYNSPKTAQEYTYEKTVIATPNGIAITGDVITWNTVTGATSYDVTIGDQTFNVKSNTVNIDELDFVFEMSGEYTLTVSAKKDSTTSLPSDAFSFGYRPSKVSSVSYNNGVLSWSSVLGAESYLIRVNGDSEHQQEVSSSSTSCEVTLTQEGVNKIRIAYLNAGVSSEWTEIEVLAYKVEFSSRGGNAVAAQYKAEGDTVTLPTATRTGYTLDGWYNVPNANGQKYGSTFVMNAVDTTVYASWSAKTYTVVLNLPDGSTVEKDVTFGKGFSLDIPTPTDGTQGFVGWYTDAEGRGAALTNELGKSITDWSTDASAPVQLYAQWRTVFTFALLSDGTYSVTATGYAANMTELTVPATYTPEGADAPVAVTVVEGYAFRNMTQLTKVSIPDTVKIIETNTAFDGCVSLEAVEVYHVEGNNDVVYMADSGILAYKDEVTGSTDIVFIPDNIGTSVRIPDGVTNIPMNTFNGKNIERVYIPSSVRTVAQNAFANCRNLVAVYFDEGGSVPLTLDDYAFNNCQNLVTVRLPKRLMSINNKTFSYCYSLRSFTVEAGGLYTAKDGVILSDGGATLALCPIGKSGSFTIPAGVSKIADGAFTGCSQLTSVVIPGYVTEIGKNAFTGCTRLSGVTFKSGAIAAQVIKDSAFSRCYALRIVTFESGSNVSEIGSKAFEYCYSLVSVTLPSSLTNLKSSAFQYCTALGTLRVEDGKALTLGSSVFNGCTALQIVELSASVATMPSNIFASCTNLSTITVDPASRNFILENGALYDYNKTAIYYYAKTGGNITLPSTVKRIEDGVFKNNVNIDTFTVGYNVEYIGAEAFAGCINLKTFTFAPTPADQDEVTLEMGNGNGTYSSDIRGTFADCTGLTSIELPTRLERIGNYAFSYCSNLKTVTIPGIYTKGEGEEEDTRTGVKEIGKYAFTICKAITSITIPGSVEKIDDNAFYMGSYASSDIKLSSLTLSEGIKTIGKNAFQSLYALTSVTFPSTLTLLDDGAFYYCSNLATVTFTDGEEELVLGTNKEYSQIFYNCAIAALTLSSNIYTVPTMFATLGQTTTKLTIPSTVTKLYGSAFYVGYTNALTTVEFEAPAAGKYDLEYVKTTSYGTNPFVCLSGSTYMKVNTITGVNKRFKDHAVPADAFKDMKQLTTVDLTGITSIGDNAFNGCTQFGGNLDISAVTSLGTGVFNGCTGLTGVTLNNGLTEIKVNTFYGTGLTSITFPTSLTKIGDSAFENSKLDGTLTIPNKVTSIGVKAFKGINTLDYVSFDSGESALTIDGGTAANGVFANCTSLLTVKLPTRLSALTDNMFDGDSALTAITVEGCEEATTLTFAEGVDFASLDGILYKKTATDVVLVLCPAGKDVDSVAVPASVTLIAPKAFYNATKVKGITFDGGDTETTPLVIGSATTSSSSDSVFYNTGITSITLPARTTVIGNYAFATSSSAATKLTSVTIPGASGTGESAMTGVTRIGDSAFQYSGLTSLTIPASVTVDGLGSSILGYSSYVSSSFTITVPADLYDTIRSTYASAQYTLSPLNDTWTVKTDAYYRTVDGKKQLFQYFGTATSYTVEDNTEIIAANAFKGNTVLTSVTIPASVKEIGKAAFYGCNKLTSVTLNEGLEKIGAQAFYSAFDSTAACSITIPSTVKEIGDEAFRSSYLGANSGTITFTDPTDTDPTDTAQELTIGERAFQSTKLVSIKIPARTVSMGQYALYVGNTLTSVTLEDTQAKPSKLTSLSTSLFAYSSGLTSLTIPASVTEVNDAAFQDCSGLVSVSFGNANVKWVVTSSYPTGIFARCSSLKNVTVPGGAVTGVTIPNSVTAIPNNTFINCSGIESVVFHDRVTSIGNSAFSGCAALTSVNLPDDLTSLGETAFSSSGITSITVPIGVSSLSRQVFDSCKSLEEVTLLGVTSLERSSSGYSPFNGCTALETVNLPACLETIGDRVFTSGSSNKFSSLTTINIESGSKLKSIGDYAFSGYSDTWNGNYVTQLTTFVCDSTVLTEMGQHVFAYTSLRSFTVPRSMKYVSSALFSGCTQLESVVIPFGVTDIDSNAFNGCTGLTSITIPGSVTNIRANAFQGCTNLTDVTLEIGVTSIGDGMFNGCTSLETIELPQSVLSISANAFSGCTGLAEVTGMENLVTIGESAFSGCTALETLVLPETLSVVGQNAFAGCNQLGGFELTGEGILFSVEDGVLFNANKTTLVQFPAGKTGTYTLPSTVKTIASYAFAGTTVSTVVLNDGLTNINSYAFNGAAVTTINIPSSVRVIGERAFYDTTELENITIANGVIEIGQYAFSGSGITEITIPASVTRMGTYMFYRSAGGWGSTAQTSNLTTVTINANISVLPSNTFQNCNNLNSVTLADNITEIGISAFQDCALLNNINLSNIEVLGSTAFRGCTSLSGTVSLSSIKNIGGSAFYGCTEITTLYAADTLEYIGTTAFQNWTASQTIKMCVSESASESWATGSWDSSKWNGYCSATIQWDQTMPAEA